MHLVHFWLCRLTECEETHRLIDARDLSWPHVFSFPLRRKKGPEITTLLLWSACAVSAEIPVIRSQLIFHTSNPHSSTRFTLCPHHVGGESHSPAEYLHIAALSHLRELQGFVVRRLCVRIVCVVMLTTGVHVSSYSSRLRRLLCNPLCTRPPWIRSPFSLSAASSSCSHKPSPSTLWRQVNKT